MDNVSLIEPALNQKLTSNITLDPFQYHCYKEGWLTIKSPEGEHLETISQFIHSDDAETNAIALHNQLYLFEYLLQGINTDINMPKQALFALTDIFTRMRLLCDEKMK